MLIVLVQQLAHPGQNFHPLSIEVLFEVRGVEVAKHPKKKIRLKQLQAQFPRISISAILAKTKKNDPHLINLRIRFVKFTRIIQH